MRRLAPDSKPVPVTRTSVPPVERPDEGAIASILAPPPVPTAQVFVTSSYVWPSTHSARATQAWAVPSSHSESGQVSGPSGVLLGLAPLEIEPDGDDVMAETSSRPPMRMRTITTAMTM